jgi:hypothetical protein
LDPIVADNAEESGEFSRLRVYFGSRTCNTQDPKGVMSMAEFAIAQTVEPQSEEERTAPMWELAECNCPDHCERDHELD